jgi:Fe-S cluster assembly protein SufD
MATTTKSDEGYARAHALFSEGRGAAAPDWIRELRADALSDFLSSGFPSAEDEDWRFTNVAPIAKGEFALSNGDATAAREAEVASGEIPGLTGPRLVFLDGRLVPSFSRTSGPPDGVTVTGLAEALAERPELLRPHLGRLAKTEGEPFTALNAAFLEDGAFVHVDRGVVGSEPVHAVYLWSESARDRMAHPRTLVVAEEGAEATLIEHHAAGGAGRVFANAVGEVVVGAGAGVRHYRIERGGPEALTVSTLHVEQGPDSRFSSHSALIGGALVRNNVYPVLAGKACDTLLNGFYVPWDRQHHDTHMRVRHAAPYGQSRQFYRGVLAGRARAVFGGRIIVDEGAQKTDAKQTDMNLLLSEDARVNTQPQLEIYADDVKCTHGATVGQIDSDAIFYLMARGIPEPTARGLMIFAFVNEVLDRMELSPVRDFLRGILVDRLPGTPSPEKER